MDEIVKIYKALSDKNRLRIISLLINGKICVCEITYVLDVATSTVSKHLSILKEANIIKDEKDGKWVNYYLNPEFSDLLKQIIEITSKKLKNDALIVSDANKLNSTNREMICEITKFN